MSGSGGQQGIEVKALGPLFTVTITGNTVQQYTFIGMFIHGAQAPSGATLKATVQNNTIRLPSGSNVFAGLDFDIGNPFEGAIGQAPPALEHGYCLMEDLLKGHRPPSLRHATCRRRYGNWQSRSAHLYRT